MSFGDTMAEIDAVYRMRAIAQTFGHLAPKPRQVYSGTVLFARGEYHDMCIIRNTLDAEDSPWLCEDLHDHFWKDKIGRTEIKTGSVYLFSGTYRKFKNGKYRFSGKVKKVA